MATGIEERFGASLLRASEISLQRRAAERAIPFKFLGLAVDPGERPYFYLQQLGAGTYGTVYAASSDATLVPQFIVKQLRARIDIDLGEASEARLRYRDGYIEREYLISEVIRRRLGEPLCQTHYVCALERFYDTNPQTERPAFGYLIFPYVTPITLSHYLATVMSSRMAAHKRVRGELAPFDTVDTIVDLVLANGPQAHAARAALREFYDIMLACLALCGRVIQAVGLLHNAAIYHQDINPSNIIVKQEEDVVMLIDFGLACVGMRPGDALHESLLERRVLECEKTYDTTSDYKDPLSAIAYMEEETLRLEYFGKFDTYATGKVMQTIFDSNVVHPQGGRDYPVVRQTLFMPTLVFILIQRMTGELDYRPRIVKDRNGRFHHYDFTLDEAAVSERTMLFNSRPSMSEVAAEFERLSEQFVLEYNRVYRL